MNLPDTLLSDIVAQGQRLTIEATDTERRSELRIPFWKRAFVCPLADLTAPLAVFVRDISLGGVGLLCGEKLAVGDEFVLPLPNRAGSQLVRVKCAVRRCDRGGFGRSQYIIGAAFSQVLDQETIAADALCR